MSSKRMVSLALVALLHAVLGYALISGLALRVVKVVTGPLETFEVEEPTVDEEPPPPPPELEEIPPYVPPPEVIVETAAPPPPAITIQTEAPRPEPVRVVPPTPAPPQPAGPTKRAEPRGRLGATITADDYPQASIRGEEEGSVVARYTINTDGRVVKDSCTIQTSSGFSRLDTQTCSLIERRFRFNPAQQNGQPVQETRSQAFRWQIPK
ncbi:energy transducer TonB [Sphingosinicella soli]|uniref:Protein TonB n=1 Tax=Sphingosinicella soli TaxID=333708 RepID=A0A7W7F788_9SPHN|nr:energy transducer TonB [Sphingosinicella soli]MBB4633171.1 protein TonB [Sphingosinicella soli]